MKLIRRSNSLPSIVPAAPAQGHRSFSFYDRSSGASHFQVAADSDGRLPVEQAACLLAMHCMVRGQSPEDYVVMVEVDPSHTDGLLDRARTLLEAGQSVKSEVKVTRREEEVLRGILRGHANKEIAGNLNLSERTVKFHVSSLLAKFRVRGRMELIHEASRFSNWAVPKQVVPPPVREALPPQRRMHRVASARPQAPVFAVAGSNLQIPL